MVNKKVKVKVLYASPEDLKDAILITGFQGFGGVGYITTRYLVNKLNAKFVGYVFSYYMPDVTFSMNRKIALPYEIYLYKGANRNIIILLNNAVPLVEKAYFADAVMSWASESGISEAILVGGLDISTKQGEGDFRCLPNSHYKGEIPGPILEDDLYIIGPLALMSIFSEIYKIPAIIVLPYTEPSRADPAAAAKAVEVISKMCNLNVDTSELYEDARAIEAELKKISELRRSIERRLEEGKTTHYM